MKWVKLPALSVLSLLILNATNSLGIREASSHTFSAPDTVYAHERNDWGDFVYNFTVTFTDTAACGEIGWSAVTNIYEIGLFDDCGCTNRGPWHAITYEVNAYLEDKGMPGKVENWIAFCGEDTTLSSVTTIMPYAPPTESIRSTWGRIKGFYRR
jgi:hypothetical protein